MTTLKTTNRTRRGLTMALLASAFLLISCEAVVGPDPEVDKAAIEAAIRAYLPALSDAYATGNIVPLKEMAVQKEILRVLSRAEELAHHGQVYEPEFKDLTIESLKTWQYANAIVTTLEVWDIRSYASGSHTLLNEVLDQPNRVKYQLKRKDQGWVILYRDLADPPNDGPSDSDSTATDDT